MQDVFKENTKKRYDVHDFKGPHQRYRVSSMGADAGGDPASEPEGRSSPAARDCPQLLPSVAAEVGCNANLSITSLKMETNQMNKNVEIGELPFTWRDVLKTFRPGDEKRYPAFSTTTLSTIRGAIFRYQTNTEMQFTTSVDEEGYIHIRRIK